MKLFRQLCEELCEVLFCGLLPFRLRWIIKSMFMQACWTSGHSREFFYDISKGKHELVKLVQGDGIAAFWAGASIVIGWFEIVPPIIIQVT